MPDKAAAENRCDLVEFKTIAAACAVGSRWL